MASRGLRDLGDGKEQIANAEEAAALRARARKMNLLTALSTALAAGLVVLASR